jgi:MscS family membrane protein
MRLTNRVPLSFRTAAVPLGLALSASLINRPVFAQQPPAEDAPDSIARAVLERRLPTFMFEIEFLGLELWQWTGLLLLVFLAGVLSWFVAGIGRRILRPLAARTDTSLDDRILEATLAPARLLLAVGVFAVGSGFLELSPQAFTVLGRIEVALVVIAVAWIGLRGVDIGVGSIREHLKRNERRAALAILPMGGRSSKVFLIVIAVLVMIQNLGFNVTGLIAGLGIGGLAVALAAQKSIANLFGGVTLIADQPIQVGDFCKFGDRTGTVEEIGLRSTRVRTLDRTLVTIPNAEFAEVQLENYAARDRIRIHAMIGLRYETSPDQLRHVLAEMRKLLIAHPMVSESPARVRFIGFGPHSLDLELFAYVKTGVWDDFLKVREDIFLRIMDIVRDSGTSFAFPSQTLYLGRDGGLDTETTRRAEEEVRAWREQNELPFPDFAPDTIARLKDTTGYPPRGSAVAKTDEGADSPETS